MKKANIKVKKIIIQNKIPAPLCAGDRSLILSNANYLQI